MKAMMWTTVKKVVAGVAAAVLVCGLGMPLVTRAMAQSKPEGVDAGTTSAGVDKKQSTLDLDDVMDKKWILESMREGERVVKLTKDPKPRITFKKSRDVTGKAFVNMYVGTYSLDQEGKLAVQNLGMSRMAGSADLMKKETLYFGFLKASARMRVQKSEMVFENDDGKTTLVFKDLAASGISGSAWSGPKVEKKQDAPLDRKAPKKGPVKLLENKKGNFALSVSNQCSATDPVDIKIYVDGKVAVNQDFHNRIPGSLIAGGHNWKAFQFSLSKGVHRIVITSQKGDAKLEKEIEIKDKHWAAVAYWGEQWVVLKKGAKPELKPKHFSITIQDKPIFFM